MGARPARRVQQFLARHLRDPVYANGYALVANAGLSALLGFLFWVLAARRFAPEHLGIGAAVVSASTLAALIGKAGFDAALIRYTPVASARGLRRLLILSVGATFALTLGVAAVVLVAATAGIESLAPLRHPAFAAGFLLLACATATAWIFDAYFVAEQAAIHVLMRNVAFNGVKLAVPLLLAASVASRAVPIAWGAGLAASILVSLVVLPRVMRRHVARDHRRLARREVAIYSARNYALNLSEFLPGLVFPLLVVHQLGPAANARFYLAWTIATVAFLASKAIAQSAFAALVRARAPQSAIVKALTLSALVLAPAVLVLHFGGGLVLAVFGRAYDGASVTDLLGLLAISIVPLAITNVYLAYLKSRDGGWELTLLPTAALAAVLMLAPGALARDGVQGLGVLWLAVQTSVGAYASARILALLATADPERPASPWNPLRNLHDAIRTAIRHRAHKG